MPPQPVRPDALRGHLFRGSAAVRDGHLTPGQLRSSAWTRLYPDVYACASLPVTHGLRTRAASRLLVPRSVVRGRSAATWWGLDAAGPDDDVELYLAAVDRAGAARGLVVSRTDLSDLQVSWSRGVRLTTPTRTTVDLARTRPLDEAVVLVDRFTSAGLAHVELARAAAADMTGRDCRHVRAVLALADGRAESPQETRLRLVLHRSTLPRPVAQHPVHHGRAFVARLDFAWPELRLGLEYDGLWHGDPAQFAADRRRLNRLLAAGWRVLFVTAADLREPRALLARIASALAA